jgi:hypothetical protein
LVTQSEIEAAAEAYLHVGIGESIHAGMLAVLEAAERVRPRRDPTNVARQRRYKAKRRNVTASEAAPGNVTANVTAPARPVTANVTALPPDDPMPLLLARLLDAAGGNVQSGANDTAPIAALIEQGCDLNLDVLPAVRDLLTDPLQPPLKRWSVPWRAAEIVRRRTSGTPLRTHTTVTSVRSTEAGYLVRTDQGNLAMPGDRTRFRGMRYRAP